ncbi:2-pyrone-4,6-dicarboxylate hydrolase [Rhodoferax lacus]|uniref:2-pyrone-4,6-dicarboxylate hydrolase n=1 Tax=Rhodoferax lacus TaxID=2184758 RepID=A0A3E1RD84_9BURK|nr:amidohydrolase family protein [Rhodoferax lacus]RFO97243.1 2-pyrone-4,6-dicarboxylate hydrolase [Rhodoferax lacus]
MSIFDEDKIDCHNHILDPLHFPYAADVAYRPAGQEIGSQVQHAAVMEAYGMRRALIVGPNSGYGEDNRCLLAALAASRGAFKGIAVVPNHTPTERLLELKGQGVVGIAFNPSLQGLAYYADAKDLMRRLADLDMLVQVQVHEDQMVELAPVLLDSGAQILIDHCGRPDPARGLGQAGFQAVLALARSGRATVKLSGLQKFSTGGWPFASALPYVDALIEAYGLDQCVWASDWPFLKASERLDVGPLLRWIEKLLPDVADRRRLFWDTPCRVLGFDPATH